VGELTIVPGATITCGPAGPPPGHCPPDERLLDARAGRPTAGRRRTYFSVFWRSWARVIRGRLPVRHWAADDADILHHGPPPAYAHGREAVGGAEAWPQVHPGVVRGARAAAGL
jgi:hypothetical protein